MECEDELKRTFGNFSLCVNIFLHVVKYCHPLKLYLFLVAAVINISIQILLNLNLFLNCSITVSALIQVL